MRKGGRKGEKEGSREDGTRGGGRRQERSVEGGRREGEKGPREKEERWREGGKERRSPGISTVHMPHARGRLATLVDQKRLGGLPGELFNSLAERAYERGTRAKNQRAPPHSASLTHVTTVKGGKKQPIWPRGGCTRLIKPLLE